MIDGRTCSAPEGATILGACRALGIEIPTLCHLDGVTPAGSCRVCLVDVRGLPRPVPACATRISAGMQVSTATPELRSHRRAVVEMLFAGGDHVCAFCPSSGRCELQELARRLGLDHVTLGVPRRSARIDASHPRFGLDPGRCVLCTRCVRVCAEVERAATLAVVGRGRHVHVVTDGASGWGASPTCTACGRCVVACPTGALFERARGAQGLAASPAVREPPRALTAGVESSAPSQGARAELRLATLQLGGCSGCHMSLLDGDGALLGLAPRVRLVSSPLADGDESSEDVDACLVEGACSTDEDVRRLRLARARAGVLVALGDCAGWGNVTAMRDAAGGASRVEQLGRGARAGEPALPALLERVLPVPEVVAVDAFLPGCPPAAGELLRAVVALSEGRPPAASGAAFG